MSFIPRIEIKINDATREVNTEVLRCIEVWPQFSSAHEAFAVLAEEVDELWDHVRKNQKTRDPAEMRKECIQIAAMAVRFAVEICNENGVRK